MTVPVPMVVALGAAALALPGASGAGGPAGRFSVGGLAVTVPRGWHVTTRPLTPITQPAQRFSVYTGPPPRPGSAPGPGQAEAIVMEQTAVSAADLKRFPPRPARFRVTRLGRIEGFWGDRWAELAFRDHGRAFYVFIGFGTRANDLSELPTLLTALDSLSVATSASPSGCAMSQLRVSFGPRVSEATGQGTLIFRLHDNGATCTLDGYPHLRLSDRQGPIPFAIRDAGDQMLTRRPPRLVRVPAGGVAYFAINKYRCDLNALRIATTLRISSGAEPGAAFATIGLAAASRQMTWCNEPASTIIDVTPFEPTRSALGR